MANQALTGVLLVGGDSTRFGSPKALAPLGPRTLAEIGWDTLAFCDQRIAVGKDADRLELPFPLVDDGTEIRAPIAGVVAGLRAALNEVCVVLPVDVPCVTVSLLRALADACEDAAAPTTGPLPGAYRKSALPVLEQHLAHGKLALHEALGGLRVARLALDPELLVNVNTPGDLARLRSTALPGR